MAKKVKELKRADFFPDPVSKSFLEKTRKLSNTGHFKEVYEMACEHLQKYPDSILFAYYEAVYTAEQSAGFTPTQVNKRKKLTAKN